MSIKRHSLRLTVLAAALILSACGDGGGADPTAENSPDVPPVAETPAIAAAEVMSEVFAQLEEDGTIPKLDRSDTLLGVDDNNNGDLTGLFRSRVT